MSVNHTLNRQQLPDPTEGFLQDLGKPADPDAAILKEATKSIDADAFYDFYNHQMFFEAGIGHARYSVELESDDGWILAAIEYAFEHNSVSKAYTDTWDEFVRRRMQFFMLQVGRDVTLAAKRQPKALRELWRETQFELFAWAAIQHLTPALLTLDEASLKRFKNGVLKPIFNEAASHAVWLYDKPWGGYLAGLPVYLFQMQVVADLGQIAGIVVPAYDVIHDLHLALLEDPAATYLYPWMKGEPPSAAGANAFFPANSVNFGLRTTYRQQWQHLGNQYGDIVRTIPLGPKQIEKVSLRVLRRNKVTRSLETSKVEESSEETMESVKDSNEIVNEAAKTEQWGILQKGQGGFDCGLWNVGGSTDVNYSEESKTSSKTTKARINENMQKTANKVRRETRVSVSVEHEETFESTRASEIVNPNDEIPTTYVYQRLLKQYRITAYLAEVTPVVFVAEEVPHSVSLNWIAEHANVIAAALLDESLREFLSELKQGQVSATAADVSPEEIAMVAKFDDLMTSTKTSLGALKSLGGDVHGIFDSSIEAFSAELGNLRERQRQQKRRATVTERLLKHVTDNKLHYCRAIWETEDPDQRMRRYGTILVPGDFRFETDEASFPGDGTTVKGVWHPGAEVVPLADIINPAGPIGFTGNYAIYHLATTFRTRGFVPLYSYYRACYEGPPNRLFWRADDDEQKTPAGIHVSFPKPFLTTYGRYRIVVTSGGAPIQSVSYLRSDGKEHDVPVDSAPLWERLTQEEKASGRYEEYRRVYSVDGDAFWVAIDQAHGEFLLDIWPPHLRDPEIIELEARYSLPPLGHSAAELERFVKIFDDFLIRDMLVILPGLLDLLSSTRVLPQQDIWKSATESQRRMLYDFYHEYRLRKDNTREIVVDTNNVVLNLHVGTGSAMEPFKRFHRYVDAKKALAEERQAATEAERRAKRVENLDYTDPDTDRTVVIPDAAHAPKP